MPRRASIRFAQAQTPIVAPATKFGGQPVWLQAPQWPLSATTGEPMQFIGQIALQEELFGAVQGQLAYIFMAPNADGALATWSPQHGENAVIIQPGGTPGVPTTGQPTGPSLQHEPWHEGGGLCEYEVALSYADEPDHIPMRDLMRLMDEDPEAYQAYVDAVAGPKLGGSPDWYQDEELPIEAPWQLLLQLHEDDAPFAINFGTGVAYVFIDVDGTHGRMLWQC